MTRQNPEPPDRVWYCEIQYKNTAGLWVADGDGTGPEEGTDPYAIANEIARQLARPGHRVVLWDQPGVGRKPVAIAYC